MADALGEGAEGLSGGDAHLARPGPGSLVTASTLPFFGGRMGPHSSRGSALAYNGRRMGFRNEEEARSHRIRALETELSERDRKIAELEAKLEERQAPDEAEDSEEGDVEAESAARSAKKKAKGRGVPKGDRWIVPVGESVSGWKVILAFLVSALFISAFMYAEGYSWPVSIAVGLSACPISLFLLHRKELILDKKAGTITMRHRVLVVRWKRHVLPFRGQSMRVMTEERYSGRESGSTYRVSMVFLGKVKLFEARNKAQVHRLVQRIAAFLEIPYRMVS